MASTRELNDKKLSKNVLQMKFMKRSVLRDEKDELEAEQQRQVDDEHWVLDIPELAKKESKFWIEPSYTVCENLAFGRMSFRGFNTEIEKLMTINANEQKLAIAAEREKETSVGDEEMAKRYSSLVNTIGNKFKKKRDRKSRHEESDDSSDVEIVKNIKKKMKMKKKFLKPKDD